MSVLHKLLHNRQMKNAAWIIFGKTLQALLGLVLSMLTARYLGPEQYGLLSYAASVTLFAGPIAQLGYTATMVYEIVQEPDSEDVVLGSAIGSSLVSSLVCLAGIAVFAAIANPGEGATRQICVLYALLLVAQSFELIQYWFQAKLLSRYTAMLTLLVYTAMAVYQIVLILTGGSVYGFAVVKGAEHALIALGLYIVYRRLGNRRPRFSLRRTRQMLKRSSFAVLSGLLMLAYGQADRIMIKAMLGNAEMGYYAAAVFCANVTDFVFMAVIDSFRPMILELKKENAPSYEKAVSTLYSMVIYMALIQSVAIAALARPMIDIMYGEAYRPAVQTLRLVIWYTVFSYLGSARSVWILAEGKQRMWWRINLCGSVVNIGLNWLLIPRFGIEGAAFASLVTQAFANVGTGFVFPELRGNDRLLLKALNPRMLIDYFR